MKSRLIPTIVIIIVIATISMFIYLGNKVRNATTGKDARALSLKQYLAPPAKVDMNMKELFTFDTLPLSIKTTENVTIPVRLASYNHTVTGFDLVISFDQPKLRWIKARSLLQDYDLYTRQQENTVIITAIQKLNVQTKHQFTKDPIVELTFLPLQTGPTSLKILQFSGKSKTKVIDETSQVLTQDSMKSVTLKVE